MAVCLLAMGFPSLASTQPSDAPTGVASFEFMVEYLSGGTGKWRAPIPPRDGGPDALGLWFEPAAGGKLLELTIVLHYGDEARPSMKGYWLWHPGRKEILYHEVSPSGRIRTGVSHFTDARTFVNLTEAFGLNGKSTSNRGVNTFTSENEHLTTAYKLDARGEWVEQQSLTWVREAEPDGR
ncbi:MAG: hypothetical protein HKN21_01775 [Candidatus Eisenbacteria bacterium]|uniref:DUF1579 domain-containing protein n=1 Tax=Eiseniibacteriota bacterium TaxID=2212470 RepID=A0A7Y2H102_UNCEI|nr:hypothetical protein [Candidatus Eisenbacteria bacterium]